MQLTPNYNLKKPEETDPIDILDLNDNADIIDAEFKKRPVASGGDVSEMTVKTLETTTTEFPVPVAGESTKTFLGKVKKFFEDTKNWMTGVCLIGQIVNNCVTNNAKLPLSAAQGKVLMDLYTVLNTNKAANSDFTVGANYIIFKGFKICWGYNSIDLPGKTTTAYARQWNAFPITFSQARVFLTKAESTYDGNVTGMTVGNSFTNGFNIQARCTRDAGTNPTYSYSWLAVGK